MFLETLCFAAVALALAAPGLVVALMNYQASQSAQTGRVRESLRADIAPRAKAMK